MARARPSAGSRRRRAPVRGATKRAYAESDRDDPLTGTDSDDDNNLDKENSDSDSRETPARPARSARPSRSTRSSASKRRRSSSPDPLSIGPSPKRRSDRHTKSAQRAKGFYEEPADLLDSDLDSRDDDDNDDDDDAGDGDDDFNTSHGLITPSRPVKPTKPPTKAASKPAPRRRAAGRRKSARSAAPNAKSKKNCAQQSVSPNLPSPARNNEELDGAPEQVIPLWQELPWFVWLRVFQHVMDTMDSVPALDWILATSRMCKAFAEPAMRALYHNPPLLSRGMAHGFFGLLQQDPPATSLNYRLFVSKLSIDVEDIGKSHKGEVLDLALLVELCPRLEVIDCFHRKDSPPFRQLTENIRWRYPPLFLETIGEKAKKLKGIRWNGRMMDCEPGCEVSRIAQLHRLAAFSRLRKLGFINFQPCWANLSADDEELAAKNAMNREHVESFAEVISMLPQLEYLSFESCAVVDDHFLSLLPRSLKTLELVNCEGVTGDAFGAYLLTHGHNLEYLYLNHNTALDLSFLTVLGDACPMLRTLSVDLKCFSHFEFYDDSDPGYEVALRVGQRPTWPASIENINLRNIRKWTSEAAEMLFQSLVDSAEGLPMLRTLSLRNKLNVSIRERSTLRDTWEARLKQVFLRRHKDPQPRLTLRPQADRASRRASKMARKKRRSLLGGADDENADARRRSTRLFAFSTNASSRASSKGRDLRNGLTRPLYAEPETEDDDDDDDDDLLVGHSDGDGPSADGGSKSGRTSAGEGDEDSATISLSEAMQGSRIVYFRHGLVEKLEVQLDNQKAAERIASMEDFVDDGLSDDPDDDDFVM